MNTGAHLFKRVTRFWSSIYGQVVIVIAVLSVFLLLAFGTIFRSVNKEYMESIIQQSGNNVCLLVEGALFQHMMENDKTALQNMLNIIHQMPGIEDVNMYDKEDNLVYSSFYEDEEGQSAPNCKGCHPDIRNMFPSKEKSFRIINIDSECSMNQKNYDTRLLLIKSPIINTPSCNTASCHAHHPDEEVLGSFIIRVPLESVDANLNKSFILASLTTFLLVVFLIFFTRRNIKRPLNAVIKASEAVSRGDKSTRLKITRHQLYDVRMVSTAFNEMLDNIQSATTELQNWSQQLEYKVQKKSEELSEIQNELIHVERIASLGKLSSSVAHEINNPLSGILTYTKLILKQLEKVDFDRALKDPMIKYLQVIKGETQRCGEIVKGLLEFSKTDQQDFVPVPLHKILKEAYMLMAHQMDMANINFQVKYNAGSDLIFCSENQIKQVCIAILMNAFEAISENGQIFMETHNTNENTIKLDITDNGCGITADEIQHIFEPFYSTKERATGIGLGLAIVHGIIHSHNGKIDVQSELNRGTTISIILPLIKS